MPEQAAKRRPPELHLGNSAPADILVRIVSPIVPLHMSSEMRNTLRLSHNIRAEQTSLIAQNSALPSDGEIRSLPRKQSPLQEQSPLQQSLAPGEQPTKVLEFEPHNEPHNAAKDKFSPSGHSLENEHSSLEPAQEVGSAPHSPAGSSSDSDFVRASELASKRLRRAKAPRPLRLLPGASAPVIKSAPMRSLYGFRRVRPVRPVYPPYSAVHWMLPRAGPVRRVVKTPAAAAPRRNVVQDVFHGAVTMAAPMNAQPLLAQRDRFDLEPERAERPDAPVRGTITLNDEAAFNFKIYNGEDAKRVFLEVCEKTWDEHMAVKAGQRLSGLENLNDEN